MIFKKYILKDPKIFVIFTKKSKGLSNKRYITKKIRKVEISGQESKLNLKKKIS